MRRTLVSLLSLTVIAACAPAPMGSGAAPPPISTPKTERPAEKPLPPSPEAPAPAPIATPTPDLSPPPPPPAKDAEEKLDKDEPKRKEAQKPQGRTPSGPPAPSEAVASGSSLSPDAVAHVVKAHMPEVKRCYDRALAANPDASGKLVLAITIDGHGNVTQASAAQSTMSADVAQCIGQRARGWVFPPPDGGGTIVVNYPFVFATP